MRTLSHKGLSMIELLAVLVLLGVISAVAVISLSTLLENSRIRADQGNVTTLNQATRLFLLSDEQGFNAWLALASTEEKINALVAYGYLSRVPTLQHSDSSFDFDGDLLRWCFQRCDPIVSVFNFIQPTFVVDDFPIKRNENSFELTEDGLLASPPATNDNIIFFPNPRNAYTLVVTGQIFPRISGNIWGGFGVLFETRLNNQNPAQDTGYILQLDRHEGQVLIRPRTNGNEGNPILRYDVTFNGGIPSYTLNTDNLRNDTVRANPWWEEPHTLRLTVSEQDGNKTLSLWIDEVFVFLWSIPQPIPFEDAATNHSGLRVWNNVPVLFTSFDIHDE